MQAEAVFDAVPKGNYVIIKGNKADANADFLRGGMEEVIGAAVDVRRHQDRRRDLHRQLGPGEGPDRDGAVPHGRTTTRSTPCSPRTTAWPAASSPRSTAQGLAGKVPVSGQDGDQAALNRVALGTQTVDVWKDARELGKTAGEAAVAAVREPRRRPRSPAPRRSRRPGGNDAQLDPAHAESDHQGQPQRGPRRRLDHQGRRCARASTAGSVAGLRLIALSTSTCRRPAPCPSGEGARRTSRGHD